MSVRAIQVSANGLAALRHALSEPDQPCAALRVLDRLLNEAIGHKLFTALVYHPQHGMAERLYSSRPDVFPSHGTKSLADAPTMARVLTSGAPYIATDARDIERDFPDHEKIFALGCGSILNVPVRRQGTVLGQVNLLHIAGHLRESHLATVETMAKIVAPSFLAISNRG